MKYLNTFFLFVILTAHSGYISARIDDGDPSENRDRLIGDTGCLWGERDCNPCVNNVLSNFLNISDNNGDHTDHTKLRIEARDDSGELMSMYTDDYELSETNKIQGVGRIPNVGDNNWFVFTRNVYGGPGAFFAGQLTDKISSGGHLGAAEDQNDFAREISVYYTMDMLSPGGTIDNHYGGLQMLGQYMVTGSRCFDPGSLTETYLCPESHRIFFYNFSDPFNVSVVNTLDVSADTYEPDSYAVTKLYNGNYLLIVNDNDLDSMLFYISDSNALDLDTTWDLRETWHKDELHDQGAGDTNWGVYDNINLVTECGTGDLYLVATHRDHTAGEAGGEDWMDLYYIEETSDSLVRVNKAQNTHMYCNWCNFDASGNIYITPEHNMVLYATEKDDEESSGDIFFEEFQNQYNLCNGEVDPDCDFDEDSLTNGEEASTYTDMYNPDTDADGLLDGHEVKIYGSDPLSIDSDEDGLADGDEVNVYGTDPANADTDGDGIPDGLELLNLLDPLNPDDALEDPDEDGVTNHDEIMVYLSDIRDADTDDDFLDDGTEVAFGSDPTAVDTDADGVPDLSKYFMGSDPISNDSDGDGLLDGDEVNVYFSDPTDTDSDDDGVDDGDELLVYGTDLQNPDTDADGLTDGEEIFVHFTDPNNPDTDGDHLGDDEEISLYTTDPLGTDTDNDLIGDGKEVLHHFTDPVDADTDDDGWQDGYEVYYPLKNRDPLVFDSLIPTKSQIDFNGDGFGDMVAYYPDGRFYVLFVKNGHIYKMGNWITDFGDENSIPLLGDFNGDGFHDVALIDYHTGDVEVATSNGREFLYKGKWLENFGSGSVRQLVGDFDGDGFDDIAIESKTGEWKQALSTRSSFDYKARQNSDQTLSVDNVFVGDFNGDTKSDLLAYRSNGKIYCRLSYGFSFTEATIWYDNFEPEVDKHFVGDLNADGMFDIVGVSDEGNIFSAYSTGDAFSYNYEVGSGVPARAIQILGGDFTADGKIDIMTMSQPSDNTRWEDMNWEVFVSDEDFFLDGVGITVN